MFVAVYPANPTQPLIAAMLDAGYQPVPMRGVIGLGEPPVISPGAAISNAVCSAFWIA